MEIITQLTKFKCKEMSEFSSLQSCFIDCSQIQLELAQDLLSAPASQAVYVERMNSLCGFLTITERRNRMQKSL